MYPVDVQAISGECASVLVFLDGDDEKEADARPSGRRGNKTQRGLARAPAKRTMLIAR